MKQREIGETEKIMPKKYRRYSENDKAETLAMLDVNGGNIAKTHRQTNVPKATIARWRDGGVHQDVSKKCAVKKEELHNIFENIAYKLTGAVNDSNISKLNVQQLITSSAICVDKMRLLREQPININQNASTADRFRKIFNDMKDRKDINRDELISEMKLLYPDVSDTEIQEITGSVN